MSIFTIEPSTEVKLAIISAFETKNNAGKIAELYGSYGTLFFADRYLVQILEYWEFMASNPEITSLSEIAGEFVVPVADSLDYDSTMAEYCKFMRDCGIEGASYWESPYGQAKSTLFMFSSDPESPKILPNTEMYEIITTDFKPSSNYKVEDLEDTFFENFQAYIGSNQLPRQFYSNLRFAESLKDVYGQYNIKGKSLEGCKRSSDILVKWLKDSGFKNAYAEYIPPSSEYPQEVYDKDYVIGVYLFHVD